MSTSTPNGNLTIQNTSGGTAAVDAGNNNRVFDINASDTTNPTTAFLVTMQGFTIRNGAASPGDLAPGAGGGIRDQGDQSLTLTVYYGAKSASSTASPRPNSSRSPRSRRRSQAACSSPPAT